MKYWEIIADKIAASGSTWGYCSTMTPQGWRYIVDARCGETDEGSSSNLTNF